MAQELHPDKNNSPNAKDKFAEINKYISAYIVHMKSYRMRVREKTMITLDQQSRIPSLGFEDLFGGYFNGPGKKNRRQSNME